MKLIYAIEILIMLAMISLGAYSLNTWHTVEKLELNYIHYLYVLALYILVPLMFMLMINKDQKKRNH